MQREQTLRRGRVTEAENTYLENIGLRPKRSEGYELYAAFFSGVGCDTDAQYMHRKARRLQKTQLIQSGVRSSSGSECRRDVRPTYGTYFFTFLAQGGVKRHWDAAIRVHRGGVRERRYSSAFKRNLDVLLG